MTYLMSSQHRTTPEPMLGQVASSKAPSLSSAVAHVRIRSIYLYQTSANQPWLHASGGSQISRQTHSQNHALDGLPIRREQKPPCWYHPQQQVAQIQGSLAAVDKDPINTFKADTNGGFAVLPCTEIMLVDKSTMCSEQRTKTHQTGAHCQSTTHTFAPG